MCHVLDTAAEKTFDDLTRLAATICETPISLVSLIDSDRQWFKSRYGLAAEETARGDAFCAHAILQDELFIVEDALEDPRFEDNPLVQGEPNIRFYAGAPITVGEDLRLGTLCVIDRRPRTLSASQSDALEILRESIVTQLELRRKQHDLDAYGQFLPMCGWCRNIRMEANGKENWVSPAEYFNATVKVTHGMCPSCAEDLRSETD